jgi:hypothetical protein
MLEPFLSRAAHSKRRRDLGRNTAALQVLLDGRVNLHGYCYPPPCFLLSGRVGHRMPKLRHEHLGGRRAQPLLLAGRRIILRRGDAGRGGLRLWCFRRKLQLQIGGDRRSSSSPGLIVMDLSRSACRARLSFLQALCSFFRRDLRPGSCAKRECKPNHESLHVRLPVDRPARPNTPGTGIPPLIDVIGHHQEKTVPRSSRVTTHFGALGDK